MTGLIYGIWNERKSEGIICFAAAAAFGKLLEMGEATNNNVEQV